MYITLTKKRLFIILCAALSGLLIITQFFSVKAEAITLSTNAQRVEYIKGLGISLKNDEYTTKKVIIPEEFGEVYNRYNKLQLKANFDLSDFRGKEVTIFTYSCIDERVVNLIVYKDKLIGGDIAEIKLGGSMSALKGVKDG